MFPGRGTMFPRGVSEYVDRMEDLIPGMKDGTVRTALDSVTFSLVYLAIYLWK